MLNYRLKENCIPSDTINPIADYLISLGIKPEDVEAFTVRPREEDELSPFLLDNMSKAVDILYNSFEQNKKFLLIVDCDVDGFTSAAIFYRFFKNLYSNAQIEYFLHEGKEHGIELDKISTDYDILVVPDAGSMQVEEQKIILSQGKQIVILDHHHADCELIENENLALVNNQLSKAFTNKSLSGAGVTFKCIQAFQDIHPRLEAHVEHFYDLAALGIISDAMDVRTLDNNYIITKGLANVKNKMFQALITKQEYSLRDCGVSKFGVAFYIAPIINGVIRAGTMEEKDMLFRGFIEEPKQEMYDHVYRGVISQEDAYTFTARTAFNIKGRQDTEKKKSFNYLCEKIEKEHLNDNKVIVVVTSKDDKVQVSQNITGLIAMELVKEYNKPVLVLRPKQTENGLEYAGSGRSKAYDGFNSFLQFVRDSEYSDYGEGHDMAFGAAIQADNLDKFIEESNNKLANIDYGNEFIEVDAIFNDKNMNSKLLLDFAKHDSIYGTNIPAPLIAVEAVIQDSQFSLCGKDFTTARINIGGTTCIKFKDADLAAQLQKGSSYKVKLVGRPRLNTFMYQPTADIMIESIEVVPYKSTSLF